MKHHKNITSEYQQDWINGITDSEYKILFAYLGKISPCVILDLCGGTGDLSLKLQKRGYGVLLADLDGDLLSVARDNGITNTIRLDLLNNDLPKGLDVVIMKSAQHEFRKDSLVNIHSKIYRSLSPNGTYIDWDVHVQNKEQSEWLLEYINIKDRIAEDFHLAENRHIYTSAEIISSLRNIGFGDIGVFHDFHYIISNKKFAKAYFAGDKDKERKFYYETSGLINKYGVPSGITWEQDEINKDFIFKIPAVMIKGEK